MCRWAALFLRLAGSRGLNCRTGTRGLSLACTRGALDSDPAGEVPAEPSADAARYHTEHFTTMSPGGKDTTGVAEPSRLPLDQRVHPGG